MTLFEMLFAWNGFGFCVLLGTSAVIDYMSSGFALLNPLWLYNHCRVNYFGAGFLALVLNLICPIASLSYWFYKLCTVGRR